MCMDPPIHPFYFRIFQEINRPAIGVPPIYGNLRIDIDRHYIYIMTVSSHYTDLLG